MTDRLKTLGITAIATCCAISSIQAQTTDSINALKATFSAEYKAELQSNFKDRSNFVNLLQLNASVPFAKRFSIDITTISTARSNEEDVCQELQGFSNITADNHALSLAVAGITWNITEQDILFAGIRRMDEDYFTSDGMGLFTNSSCGVPPTVSSNFPIATYPFAGLGIHYAHTAEHWTFQGSIYNGTGHNRFSGDENIYRFCPRHDGIFALTQAEYSTGNSRYFLGGTLHYGTLEEASRLPRVTTWAYMEQELTPQCQLLAIYSHAIGSDIQCRNFAGIGATYATKPCTIGIFSDYTRIDGADEWATELTCDIPINRQLSIQPAFHVINTDGITNCAGSLRFCITVQ